MILFSYRPGKHNLAGDVELLLPVRFRQIAFRGFREEVSVNHRPVGNLDFLIVLKNTKLVGALRFCFLSSFDKLCSSVLERKSKYQKLTTTDNA